MPDTYGKTWWRDGYACGCMIQSIEDVIEPRLRAAGCLGAGDTVDVYQYSYNTSVEASGGTHSGGGSLDHGKGSDAETVIWRECGVADWQRGDPQDPHFDDHNHGIWIGCPHVSGAADDQIDQYKAGCDGLAGWGPDQSPSVAYITWQDAYDKYAGTAGGLFGMSTKVFKHRTKTVELGVHDDWKDLPLTDDKDPGYSAVTGETDAVTASANVLVSGLADGETFDICWRIAAYKDGAATTYPHTRPRHRVRRSSGDGSSDSIAAVYNGGVPANDGGRSHRLRLSYRTTSAAAEVADIVVEGWST